jgi:hypothetical protein
MLDDETSVERQGSAAGDQEGLAEAHLPHQLGRDPEGEDDQAYELKEATGPVAPGLGGRRLGGGWRRPGLPPRGSDTVASLGHEVPR